MKLILASGSPRRKELLKEAEYEYEIILANVDEKDKELSHLGAEELVEVLSKEKAEYVASKHLEDVVLGADTIVELGGEILGKPKDKEDAINMLSKMQGRWHNVYTGVTICNKGQSNTFVVKSSVKFHPLSVQQIKEYLDKHNVLDKAGAYGIQDGMVVETYEGSYTNIVGLPMEKVKEELNKYGV